MAADKALVVRVATPPTRFTVPSTVKASRKVTVPVGELPVTVAVKVTGWPKTDGFWDEVNNVELGVAARAGPSATSDIAQAASKAKPFIRASLSAHARAAPQRPASHRL